MGGCTVPGGALLTHKKITIPHKPRLTEKFILTAIGQVSWLMASDTVFLPSRRFRQ